MTIPDKLQSTEMLISQVLPRLTTVPVPLITLALDLLEMTKLLLSKLGQELEPDSANITVQVVTLECLKLLVPTR